MAEKISIVDKLKQFARGKGNAVESDKPIAI